MHHLILKKGFILFIKHHAITLTLVGTHVNAA